MTDRAHIEEVEEQAALYALGAVTAGEAEQFRKRLEGGCALCRNLFESYRGVSTALAVSVPELDPPARLRGRLLESIGTAPAGSPSFPGTLVREGETPWRATKSPGVQFRSLRGRRTFLLKFAPDSWYPEHDHAEAEECLVLDGTVESDGMTAAAGDYLYMPKGTHHAPLYSKSGCTLLIAYTA